MGGGTAAGAGGSARASRPSLAPAAELPRVNVNRAGAVKLGEACEAAVRVFYADDLRLYAELSDALRFEEVNASSRRTGLVDRLDQLPGTEAPRSPVLEDGTGRLHPPLM